MTLPAILHKAVLAGVARVPLAPDSAGPALQTVLASVPEAMRLWHTLAASDLAQRAGFQPLAGAPQTPCAEAPTCPRAAEQVLLQILRGIHAEQLDSWLALARQRGMSLPHSALVPLLDQGLQKPALRAALIPLLGARGHWLAAQHPSWAEPYAAASEDPAAQWQLGSLPQRCAALQAMRRADPAAALAALAADWAQEPPENRAALLPCLATGLSLADEDFLERALDDKRKEVRSAAQQLLASLPGSQLVARCQSRLTALFTLEQRTGLAARLGAMLGGASLPELKLILPEACDAAMRRDGIGADKHRGLGEKAGWLLDMMRCVPPAAWSERWQLSPRQVLEVLHKHEFNTALLAGVVQACARTLAVQPQAADTGWFLILLNEGAQAGVSADLLATLLPEVRRLPAADQERLVQRWLEQGSSGPNTYAYALDWAEQRLIESGATLSAALSQQVLASAQRQMKAAAHPDYLTRRHFAVLARVLDTSVLAAGQPSWPASHWEHWPQWRQLVDDLTETLQFRQTMQASFLETDA